MTTAALRRTSTLSGTDFLFEPGAYFSYCNAGTILAGRVVEVLRGAPWEAVVQERILDPLGMCDTSFVPGPSPRADAESARGHLVTPTGITPLPSDHIETYTTLRDGPRGRHTRQHRGRPREARGRSRRRVVNPFVFDSRFDA